MIQQTTIKAFRPYVVSAYYLVRASFLCSDYLCKSKLSEKLYKMHTHLASCGYNLNKILQNGMPRNFQAEIILICTS